MPQSEKIHAPAGQERLEGKEITPSNTEELNEAIRLAFDYRGDTTLLLKDGSSVEGYIYNIDSKEGLISVFVKEGGKDSVPKTVYYSQVRSVLFSGADTAFGKSWDDWSAKSEKQREEEAERARQLASKLGHL